MKTPRNPVVLLTLAVGGIVVVYLQFNICHRQPTAGDEKVTKWHKNVPSEQWSKDNLKVQESVEKCQVEFVDPFHPDIVQLVVRPAPTLRCDLNFLPEITMVESRQLKVDRTKLRGSTGHATFSHCRYRNVAGKPEDDMKIVFSEWSEPFRSSVRLGEDSEFIHVNCFSDSKEENIISKSFFSLVPTRRHLDKLYDVKLNKRRVKYQPRETLNVVIVGIDGLSRHQFMRTMPKTYKYLTRALGSFDFTMQGQHGDNTFSNFLPLLSGNLESEVKEWWNNTQPQDAFGFMFDDFEKAGFRTLYSEDNPLYSGFYWGDRFFINPLTSYWNRPLHLAMVAERGFVTRNGSCLGPQTISEFQLNYLLDFLNTFHDKPVFAVSFFDAITHYETASAGVIDEHLFNFYKSLNRKGHLNKSLVILLSDHGPRWGKVRQGPNGRVESRNPLLFLTFPSWFLQKYKTVEENLRANTRVLTSYLDAHQMLLDLLYFQSAQRAPIQRSPKGLSMLEKLPQRTCDEAYIPEHQCFCKKWIETPIDISSRLARDVSRFLLLEIKSRSDKTECEEFSLGEILTVHLLTAQVADQAEDKKHPGRKLYQVRLTTRPGLASFEGKVHYNSVSKYYKVEKEIERLNLFRGERECLPTRRQVYCYCKGNNRKYDN
ncbi:hypothetical protein ElyMa_002819400 [Elysia marginata]|uniref:Sulfatase N-terminal domain-containing protein n=1 Tax=Elysia marginata TaxID=1093978 RepID=A0AAV4HRB4_9GAST|nr:hypothetical protein ElyMa_002819400 [Elysia marginata]